MHVWGAKELLKKRYRIYPAGDYEWIR